MEYTRKNKTSKNKGKCTEDTKQPRVNHSSDKLSIFPTFSKFEGDTSSRSCGKSVIFPHLVGFHSSRQNID